MAAGLVADFLLARQAGLSPDPEWEPFGTTACQWLGLSADDLQHWRETFGEADTLAAV